MYPELALILMLAITCLYWWVRDREREVQRRYDNCVHPPERQVELRVSSFLHPAAVDTVIPGKRWLKKHCEACGWQRSVYAPSGKPWAKYKAEYDQETIDREAEYKARHREHLAQLQYEERVRQQKRDKEVAKQHGGNTGDAS